MHDRTKGVHAKCKCKKELVKRATMFEKAFDAVLQ
jgi:hypothetical protein